MRHMALSKGTSYFDSNHLEGYGPRRHLADLRDEALQRRRWSKREVALGHREDCGISFTRLPFLLVNDDFYCQAKIKVEPRL